MDRSCSAESVVRMNISGRNAQGILTWGESTSPPTQRRQSEDISETCCTQRSRAHLIPATDLMILGWTRRLRARATTSGWSQDETLGAQRTRGGGQSLYHHRGQTDNMMVATKSSPNIVPEFHSCQLARTDASDATTRATTHLARARWLPYQLGKRYQYRTTGVAEWAATADS